MLPGDYLRKRKLKQDLAEADEAAGSTTRLEPVEEGEHEDNP